MTLKTSLLHHGIAHGFVELGVACERTKGTHQENQPKYPKTQHHIQKAKSWETLQKHFVLTFLTNFDLIAFPQCFCIYFVSIVTHIFYVCVLSF
jgi:hypothetical protein